MSCPSALCSCPRILYTCFVRQRGFAHVLSFCSLLMPSESLLMFRPSGENGCSCLVLRTFDHVYNSSFTHVLPASSSVLFRSCYFCAFLVPFRLVFDCFGSCFVPSKVCSFLVLLLFAHALESFAHVSSLGGIAIVLSFCSLLIPSDSLLMFRPPRKGGKGVAHVLFFGPFIMFMIQSLLMFCLPVLRSNLVLEIFAHFLVTFRFFSNVLFFEPLLISGSGSVFAHVSSLGIEGKGCSCLVLLLFARVNCVPRIHCSWFTRRRVCSYLVLLRFFAHVSSLKGVLLMFCPSALCSCPRIPYSCFVPRGKGKKGGGCSCFVLRNFDHVYNSTFAHVLPASSSLLFRP